MIRGQDRAALGGALPKSLFFFACTWGLVVAFAWQMQSTGAIPGDEFHGAGVLYRSLPWMLPIGRVACLAVGLGLALRAWNGWRKERLRGARLLCVAGVSLGVAGAVLGVRGGGDAAWLLLATLFMISAQICSSVAALEHSTESERARLSRLGAALANFSGPVAGRLLLALALASFLGATFVAGIESVIYTAHFAPRLFPADLLGLYRIELFELCASFGLLTALRYGLAWLLMLPGLRWLSTRSPAIVPLAAALAVASLMVLFMGASGWLVVGDPVRETGTLLHSAALLGLLHLYFMSAGERYLSAADEGLLGRGSCAWALALGAPLALPFFPARFYRAAILTGSALWFGLLVLTAYPELQDFRSYLISLGVMAAVHVLLVMILCVFGMGPAILRGRLRSALVCGVALLQCLLAAFAWIPLTPQCALVLHEYSRFAYVIKNGALSTWTTPKDRLGYEQVLNREPFEYHGAARETVPAAPLANAQPPIVVLMWDAARPDHMGCYGYERATTPHADRLAAESIVFESAYSMSTATTCGVRHILTGQYSSRFMLETEHDPFVVHRLRELGYRDFFITAFGSDYNGVSLDSFLRKGPGVESDGARFLNVTEHPQGLNREVADSLKVEAVVSAWKSQMESHGSLDGTFTWLHFTGCHYPWSKPDGGPDFGDSTTDLYDAEMAQVDALTGQALDALRSMGEYDDALIVLLADHGTGLGEHGRLGGFLPYEEQIRIPMLLHLPGGSAGRVTRPVASIDLAPTLDRWLDPLSTHSYHGVSLLSPTTQRSSFVSLCAFEDAYALIEDGRWKLHYHRDQGYAALFDLEQDPGERVNLVERFPGRTKRMVSSLGAFLWQGRGGYGNPNFYRSWKGPVVGD